MRKNMRKSMMRKSMKRKIMKRKSMNRKSMNRKSMMRKSMNRKSMSRKSMMRKSMNRKSMNRKCMKRSMNKNYYGGEGRQEQPVLNGCPDDYPYCVNYECNSRLGRCFNYKSGKYCRQDQDSNAWTSWQSDGPHYCKLNSEVEQDVLMARNKINDTLDNFIRANIIEIKNTDGYIDYEKLEDEILSEIIHLYNNNQNFNTLIELRKKLFSEINDEYAKFDGYLRTTNKDNLTGYINYKLEFECELSHDPTSDRSGHRCTGHSRWIEICNMFKKTVYMGTIFLYSYKLGINVDDSYDFFDYENLEENIKKKPFKEIETLYHEVKAEIKKKEKLRLFKENILLKINDYIRKSNECCREQQEELMTMENLEGLSKEGMESILHEKNTSFYTSYHSNPTTVSDKVRLETFKIGEIDKEIEATEVKLQNKKRTMGQRNIRELLQGPPAIKPSEPSSEERVIREIEEELNILRLRRKSMLKTLETISRETFDGDHVISIARPVDVTLTPEPDDRRYPWTQLVYSHPVVPVNPVTTFEPVVEGTAALREDILDGGPLSGRDDDGE
jgi:hypothetical protein